MALYESTFIARQDITPKDVDKLTESFSKLITDNGGKIVKSEYWGLRNLSYPINKNKKGHYVHLGIDGPAAAIKEMERNIRLHEDVMRNLTIAVDNISNDPSPVLSSDSNEHDIEEKSKDTEE